MNMPGILAPEKLRQENHPKCEAGLVYIVSARYRVKTLFQKATSKAVLQTGRRLNSNLTFGGSLV